MARPCERITRHFGLAHEFSKSSVARKNIEQKHSMDRIEFRWSVHSSFGTYALFGHSGGKSETGEEDDKFDY
jgi:hypothetical protein